MRIYKVKPVKERLLEKRVIKNECWLFPITNRKGYGQITTGSRKDGSRKNIETHRLSWKVFIGDIPEGLRILHKCDVPACFNPEHLFLGTQKDNIQDCILKGRFNMPRKIKDEVVMEIRRLSKIKNQYELAEKFNVSQGYISDIVNRKVRVNI